MRAFYLNRLVDVSGVSGTGIIAEGVEFSDGRCCLRFLTNGGSTALYDTIDQLMRIHGHGGSTKLKWLSPGSWSREYLLTGEEGHHERKERIDDAV